MNTLIRFWSMILVALLCLASAWAQAPTVAKLDASVHISTFTDSRNFGKDPFFPRSSRRSVTPTVHTNFVLQPGELPPGMVLNGLSGTKDRPLAIINNRTFSEGEQAEIRVGHLLYRVKVIEIKERSVMISVNDTPQRELTLRQGL